MNTQQLRQSLKIKWINYYQTNRSWLVKMRIWGTYKGQRRPLSSFILATLSVLETELTDMFPLILDLNNHPDEIIDALGLNFNPEEHLYNVESEQPTTTNQPQQEIETLVHHPVSIPCERVVISNQIENQVQNQSQLMPLVAIPVHFINNTNNDINKSKPPSTATPAIVESQKKTVELAKTPHNFSSHSNLNYSYLNHSNSNHSHSNYTGSNHSHSNPSDSNPSYSNHSYSNPSYSNHSHSNHSHSNHSYSKNNLQKHSHIAQSFLVSIEEQKEGQLLDMETDSGAYEVNKSPIKASTIASWIDEFCQGSGWDREEAVYIRF